MLRQSALVFGASMVLSACGFVFHAIASRRLGVDEYGTLYALISAASIAGIPAIVLAPVVARWAAEFRALADSSHLRGLMAGVARGFGLLGAIYVLGALLGAVPFAAFLHVPSWTAPFVGVLAAAAVTAAAMRAIAQGTQDFNGYSVSNVVEGIAKVVAAVVLLAIGLKLLGAVLAFFLGSFCGLTYVGARLAHTYRDARPQVVRYDWRRIAMASAGSASATIAMTLMGFADVVLVKHYFDARQAGLYAAASLGGRILLYLVGFIPTVLLPQAADRHARGARTREVLAAGLGMFAIVALCGLIAFRFFGTVILHALVGVAFDAAAPLLMGYAIAMSAVALTSALASYGIATHRLAFTLPLLACTLATLGAIVWLHSSLAVVVDVMVIGNLVTAAVVIVCLSVQWAMGPRVPAT